MKKTLIIWLFTALSFKAVYSIKNLYEFIPNKGQIHDQNFKVNSEVKFLLCLPGINIQLKKNSFSYDTYFIEDERVITNNVARIINLKRPQTEKTYRFHRVDVEFIGANPQPEIIAENPNEPYYNYYSTNESDYNKTNIHGYKTILYKNIYPNTDLEFIAKDGQMKYNFILHYGADINLIKWKYNGATNIEMKSDLISINNGKFTEEIPESYLAIKSQKLKPVKIDFIKCEDGVYGFGLNQKLAQTKDQVLIIDPILNLLWATYFGGTKNEFISSSCIDAIGNTYYMGCTSSLALVATSGAFQTSYGGGPYDAMLFKFNPFGVLQWATYLGGSSDEDGYGIVIDKSNNLYVCGYTSGSSTFTTSGAHQTSYGGGSYDAYLAKFTNNGNLIWSTFYGGNGTEYSYSCELDTIGNIYLSGVTSSTNGISTFGSYQTNYGGGVSDGFIAKFNSNGVRIWGTYFGGPDEDAPQYCKIDKNNCIYLSGYTTSSVSISTPSSHQPNQAGNWDSFLTKFSPSGFRIWSTYYGGIGTDYVTHINCDSLFNVYLTGTTSSSVAIASPGSHQTIYGGSGSANIGDAFLVKFDSSGVRQWGTYYGGAGDENGMCIAFKGQNVYCCGVTTSYTQISTANTFQNTINSPFADMFLAKFDLLGNRQWGTYIGGGVNDIPYFMLINQIGDIYLCGTSDGTFPVTGGAYQTNLNGMIEGIIVKLRENSVIGIAELNNEGASLLTFPNPNSGSFTIQTKEDVVLEIVDEIGQLVKTVKLDTNNNHQITIIGLADGVYCLKDKLSGVVIKSKIVVVR